MAESCENLAGSVIRVLPRKKPVIVLVDETSLHDRRKAMVVRRIRGAGGPCGDDDLSSDSVADEPRRDDNDGE